MSGQWPRNPRDTYADCAHACLSASQSNRTSTRFRVSAHVYGRLAEHIAAMVRERIGRDRWGECEVLERRILGASGVRWSIARTDPLPMSAAKA